MNRLPPASRVLTRTSNLNDLNPNRFWWRLRVGSEMSAVDTLPETKRTALSAAFARVSPRAVAAASHSGARVLRLSRP